MFSWSLIGLGSVAGPCFSNRVPRYPDGTNGDDGRLSSETTWTSSQGVRVLVSLELGSGTSIARSDVVGRRG